MMQDVTPITIRRIPGQSIGLTPFRFSISDCRAGRGGPNSQEMLERCHFAAQHGGLPVQSVRAGSLADEAGVLPWDVIVSIQGMPIGTYTGEQAIEFIRNIPEMQDIHLQIVREGFSGNQGHRGGPRPPNRQAAQFAPKPMYQEYEDRDRDDDYYYDNNGGANARDYTQFGTGHQPVFNDHKNNRHLAVGTGYIANPNAHEDYDSYADHYEDYQIGHMGIQQAGPTQGYQQPPHGYQQPPPPQRQMPQPPPPIAMQPPPPVAPPPVQAAPAPAQKPSPFYNVTIKRESGPLGLTPFKYALLDCEAQKDGFNFAPMLQKCAFAKKYGGGLPVQFVVPGTPASKAGVLPWDVILSINGTDIRQWPGEKIITFLKGITTDLNLKLVRSGVINFQPQNQNAGAPTSAPAPISAPPAYPPSSSHPIASEPPRPTNAIPSSAPSSGPVSLGHNLLDFTIKKENGLSLGLTPFRYSIMDAESGKDGMAYGDILKKLEFARQHGGLPVQIVQTWGSAFKAGIQPWDVVVAVNGSSLRHLSGDQCIQQIKSAMESGDARLTICRSPVPIAAPLMVPVGTCCSCVGMFGSKPVANAAALPPIDDEHYKQVVPSGKVNGFPALPPSPLTAGINQMPVSQPQNNNPEVWESYAL